MNNYILGGFKESIETDENLRHIVNNLDRFALKRYGKFVVQTNNLSSNPEYELVSPTKQSNNVHHRH
ncbi:Hypothetical protein HVR_LOCUS1252 [uncultured virus]|nr:Hypothetical protein HVR_LOCUS1252 [uncultured virus]